MDVRDEDIPEKNNPKTMKAVLEAVEDESRLEQACDSKVVSDDECWTIVDSSSSFPGIPLPARQNTTDNELAA